MMDIGRLKNHKVFISFPSLYDTTQKKIQHKIVNIANIFSSEFYIEITGKFDEDVERLISFISNTKIDMERVSLKISGNILIDKLLNLIAVIDNDKIMLELYSFSEANQTQYSDKKYLDSSFYMCISDNNGPFIIFDSNLYKYSFVVPKIKSLLKK